MHKIPSSSNDTLSQGLRARSWIALCVAAGTTLAGCSSGDNVTFDAGNGGQQEEQNCQINSNFTAEPGTVEQLSANSVRTTSAIIINAPSDLVWQTLLDTDAMPSWSPSFLGLSGSLSAGSNATIRYRANGEIQTITRRLRFERGSLIGWSGPLSESPSLTEQRNLRLERLSACQSRFSQENVFTGGDARLSADQAGAQALQRYESFNSALKARVEAQYAEILSCTPNLSIADQPQGSVSVQSGELATVETSTVINAPRYQVWNAFTDFDAMPSWSPTLQSIEGGLCECGTVRVNEKDANGQLISYDRQIEQFIDNTLLGWSESTGGSQEQPYGGFIDNRRFVLESVSACQTRFSQTNAFNGEGNPSYNALGMANYFLPLYQNFNAALKRRVER